MAWYPKPPRVDLAKIEELQRIGHEVGGAEDENTFGFRSRS